MKYFVTGIDTDSGKTLASAILCEALGADYWKPVQAGLPRDADTVMSLVTKKVNFYPEQHLLKLPASPHASAKAEEVSISLQDFTLPNSPKLIVEGAGGCLVPINNQHFIIDIAVKFKLSVVLVSNLYLGSINHTLLTASLLAQKKVDVKGIIFNGIPNQESESIIIHHTGYKQLLHIKPEPFADKTMVKKYAEQLLANWNG